MFERMKRSLVESYIGAIALGYLLAESILYFVGALATPLSAWASLKQFPATSPRAAFSWADSLSFGALDLAKCVVILVLWYFLFRWLYLKPTKTETSGPASSPEQAI